MGKSFKFSRDERRMKSPKKNKGNKPKKMYDYLGKVDKSLFEEYFPKSNYAVSN